MRQGLLLAVFLTTFTICLTSSVIHKEIHPDGTKDFTIVKYIKKNQCTCSCKCIPDSLIANERKLEQSEVILARSQHTAEEVKAASKESEIADFSGENNSKESGGAASNHESIRFEQTTTIAEEADATSTNGFYENSTRQEFYESTISANITSDTEIATTNILGIHLGNTSEESITTQSSIVTSNAQEYVSRIGSVETSTRNLEITTTVNDEINPSSTDIMREISSTVDISNKNETLENEFVQNETTASIWNNNFENIAESAVTWNASNEVLEVVESGVNGSLESINEPSTTIKPEESNLSNIDTSSPMNSFTTSNSSKTIVISTTTAILESSSSSEESTDRTMQNLVSDANTNISAEIEATTEAYTENNATNETSSATVNPQIFGEPTDIPSDLINASTATEVGETVIEEDFSIINPNATSEIVEVVETIQEPIEHPEIPKNITVATTHHSSLESSPPTDEITTTNEHSTTSKGFQESTTTESDDDGSSEEETDDESIEETTGPDVTTTATESYSTEENALLDMESSNGISSFKEEKEANSSLESERNLEVANGNSTIREHLIASEELQDNTTATKRTETNENDADNKNVATEENSVKNIPKMSRKIYQDKYGRIVFRVLSPEKELDKNEPNMNDTLRENKKARTDENTASGGRKQSNIKDDDQEGFQKESSSSWNTNEHEAIINSESESHVSESNEHLKKLPATLKVAHEKDETFTKQVNTDESSSLLPPKGDASESETSHVLNSGELPSEITLRTTTKTRNPIEDATEATLNSQEMAALGAEAIESEIKGGNIQEEKSKIEIGAGRSFIIETKHGETPSSKIIENDGNERIRKGWREALERLRQKLRAHREQSKEKKIVVNVEENHTNMDDKFSNEATKRSDEKNDDDDDDNGEEEKHLYLVQVIRDGKSTTTLSPSIKTSVERKTPAAEGESSKSTSHTSMFRKKSAERQNERPDLTSTSEAAADHRLTITENKDQLKPSSPGGFKESDRSENSPSISVEETKETTQNLTDKKEKEITSQRTHNSADVNEALNESKESSDSVTKLKGAALPIGENLSEGEATLNGTKLTEIKATESGKFEESALSLSEKTVEGNESPTALVADDHDSVVSSTIHSESNSGTAESTEIATDERQVQLTTLVKKEEKNVERENGSDVGEQHENIDKEGKTRVESYEKNGKSSTQEAKKENNENLTEERKLEKDNTKLDKDEQKSIPEFEFSIDGPSEDGLKEGMSITIDRRPDESVALNSGKIRQSSIFNKWNRPTINEGAPVNAKLLRRKIEEERNIAILKEEEMERFKEEEAIRMKEQAERAQFLAQEEQLLEMELNASNEEKEQRIREERERLEKARLLREEQMRIDRLHELNKGDEQKKELERREQITEQLEQLAESERKQHELIAQQEMALRMKEKAVKIAVLKATQNTSNASNGLLSSIPTTVNRSTPEPTVTPSRADGMQLSRAQCEAIRKFARVFQMANPAEWVRENCPFAKQYFPRASCSQIQQLFESCMQRT